MSEFGFIEKLRRRVVDRPPVRLGIGDDAAVLAPSDKPLLVTTDLLMEGTDFKFPETSPELAGRKTLAVNLSDIAAMAGIPTAAFVSVALPRSRGETFAEAFFSGLLDLADEFGVTLAGGDTNAWDQPLVASVTLLGHPAGNAAVPRTGAKPGDRIFVTGELGGSIHGHHLTFTPRIEEAKQLVALVDVHAMIDLSDGLAADLHHVLDASRVGAVIEAETIPSRFPSGGRQPPESGAPAGSPSNQGADAPRSVGIHHALADGEDFELLFTVSPDDAKRLESQWSGPTRLTCLGEITAERKCWLQFADGTRKPLPPLGWQHRF
jgi:thiamine-monophosphate kinase